ncbi:hypothetical protein CDD80_7176 [Ophiocordyceps camponoti-rufipedis]|uniref:Uncharacterized protein n=1 Tax=Ophiocordyceps camponoti-rufipedis TaxID=2004952 RepID=A0A2C5ZER9_9HYPO|nr:hypothetical protein CDD80_7176 [Ophiocordyceps camponoti-rufipedis]
MLLTRIFALTFAALAAAEPVDTEKQSVNEAQFNFLGTIYNEPNFQGTFYTIYSDQRGRCINLYRPLRADIQSIRIDSRQCDDCTLFEFVHCPLLNPSEVLTVWLKRLQLPWLCANL